MKKAEVKNKVKITEGGRWAHYRDVGKIVAIVYDESSIKEYIVQFDKTWSAFARKEFKVL